MFGKAKGAIFAPLAAAIARLPADRWPTHEELTALAEGVVTSRGKPLRFIAPRERRFMAAGRYPASCSVEPGLSSPLLTRAATVWLASRS